MAATNIAKLSVLFSSDARQFDKGIKKSLGTAAKRFAAFSKTVALAGAGAATAIAGIVKSAASAADSLAKTSRKLGVTIDELAGLRHAGEQTGVSMQTMDMAVQRMTRRVAEAAAGTGEAVKALKELGLSADELNKAGPAEAMRQIAEAMKGVENQGDKVRLAMKLFDSEGVALVNTLGIGAEGLREMQAEAVALGLSFSEIDAKKFEDLNDDIDVMRKQLMGARNVIAVELLPVVQELVAEFETFNLSDMARFWVRSLHWLVKNVQLRILQVKKIFSTTLISIGESVDGLLNMFPRLVDGVIASVEWTINAVIEGINSLVNSAKTAIDGLNSLVSKIPGIDIQPLGRSNLVDHVELGRSEEHSSIFSGGIANQKKELAELDAKIAETAEKAAGLRFHANYELVDLHDTSRKYTELTVDSIDRVVDASGGGTAKAATAATDAIRDMTREATLAEKQIERVWDRTMNDMSSALTGMITDGRTQWANFGDWFKAWTASTVAEYVADWATGMAKRIAMEAAMAGAKSSIGWVSSLSKAFLGPQSSYFGGGNLTGKARGGAVSGSVPYMVGERGPEVVIPGSNGTVVPNHKLGGGGGGIVINQNFSAGVSEAQLFEAARTTYEAAKTGVAEAVARGGGYRRQLQY